MEEATPMYLILLGTLAALTLTGAAWWQYRRLQHAIRAERAAVQLLRGVDRRDMDAFRARIQALLAEKQAVAAAEHALAEAERIVTAELARTPHYPHHPHEGDTP
jgi:hypothetical protein